MRAPDRIWLQWHGDAMGDLEDLDAVENDPGDVTWCKDQVFEHDTQYVRIDLVRAALEAERFATGVGAKANRGQSFGGAVARLALKERRADLDAILGGES